MDEPTFEKLADQVTDGLNADPELRLDVRAEILAHLEDAAEHADGATPDERAAHAVKSFGTPLDIAGALLEANQPRMAWRARLRLLMTAVLIPLAVLVAMILVYGRAARFANTVRLFSFSPWRITLPELPGMLSVRTHAARYDAKHGPPPRTREEMRAFALRHRAAPGGVAYYAIYATRLAGADAAFVREMRLGEQLEPDNALYNYRLARYYLDKGMEARSEQHEWNEGKRQGGTDTLRDRRMMALGLAEYRNALKKPYYDDHVVEAEHRRMAALPAPKLFEDYLTYTESFSSIIFRHLAEQRTLARKIGGCARLLAAEGRTDDAVALVESWKPVAVQQARGSRTLIQLLVAIACAEIAAKDGAELYDALGHHALAAQTRRECAAFAAPRTRARGHWRGGFGGPSPAWSARKAYLERRGSLFTAILLPVYDRTPTAAELAPARYAEYAVLERIVLSGVLAALASCLLCGLILAACWSAAARRAQAASCLLLPSWRALAWVFGWGMLLPLGLYALLSRLPVIGVREYGFGVTWPAAAVLLVALLLALALLPYSLMGRVVRARCAELAVPVPDRRTARRVQWTAENIVTGAGLLLLGLVIGVLYLGPWSLLPAALLALLLLLVAGTLLRRLTAAHRAYARYFGTLNRSLAPIFALAILVLCLIVHPYLQRSEVRYLRADTLLFPKPQHGYPGFPIEARTVAHWKQEMLAALDAR
ncbi:MAG TPA: hypothetical protein PLZ36_06330 [Armatimonadota bacterium]|nr:hypothetical protein [Armatimonadota bacterium]